MPFVTNEKYVLLYSDFSDLKVFCVASYPRQVLPGTAQARQRKETQMWKMVCPLKTQQPKKSYYTAPFFVGIQSALKILYAKEIIFFMFERSEFKKYPLRKVVFALSAD